MGRERATRSALRALGARRFAVRAALLTASLMLPACETLPGFGGSPPPRVVAVPSPLVAPMPPPARPRSGGSAALRFRTDLQSPAPATELAAAPVPPPAPAEPAAPTIRAETQTAASVAPLPAPIPAAPPPLAGGSAATEVARAEPAAPPPAPLPAQSPPPPIDPASLRGATTSELRDRFGAPVSQSPIASGMSWHYERAACKATFVLLPELTSGALRVFSYEITPNEGAMFGPAGCLGQIAATRGGRTAGTAP